MKEPWRTGTPRLSETDEWEDVGYTHSEVFFSLTAQVADTRPAGRLPPSTLFLRGSTELSLNC